MPSCWQNWETFFPILYFRCFLFSTRLIKLKVHWRKQTTVSSHPVPMSGCDRFLLSEINYLSLTRNISYSQVIVHRDTIRAGVVQEITKASSGVQILDLLEFPCQIKTECVKDVRTIRLGKGTCCHPRIYNGGKHNHTMATGPLVARTLSSGRVQWVKFRGTCSCSVFLIKNAL